MSIVLVPKSKVRKTPPRHNLFFDFPSTLRRFSICIFTDLLADYGFSLRFVRFDCGFIAYENYLDGLETIPSKSNVWDMLIFEDRRTRAFGETYIGVRFGGETVKN